MSIKIDSPRSPVPVSRPTVAEAAPGRAAAAGTGPSPGDSVRLTDQARLAQALTQAMASTPDVDAGRVAQTRAALAEGRYQVDAPLVAAKLLRFEWDLRPA